jgi:hypothetical protein
MPNDIGIYVFTFPNGKQYIGQTTVSFEERWKHHLHASRSIVGRLYNLPLYRSIRKYGWDNVIKDVVCICSLEQVDQLECTYIERFKTLHPDGYNLTTGGNSRKQICASSKKRMLLSLKKRHIEKPMSDKSKLQIGDSLREYYANQGETLETKEKKSESHRKRGFGLPRYVNVRNFPSRTVYCIGKHPKLKYKQFDTLEECLEYLFRLDMPLDLTEDINLLKVKLDNLKIQLDKVKDVLNDVEKQLQLFQQFIINSYDKKEQCSETKCYSVEEDVKSSTA